MQIWLSTPASVKLLMPFSKDFLPYNFFYFLLTAGEEFYIFHFVPCALGGDLCKGLLKKTLAEKLGFFFIRLKLS